MACIPAYNHSHSNLYIQRVIGGGNCIGFNDAIALCLSYSYIKRSSCKIHAQRLDFDSISHRQIVTLLGNRHKKRSHTTFPNEMRFASAITFISNEIELWTGKKSNFQNGTALQLYERRLKSEQYKLFMNLLCPPVYFHIVSICQSDTQIKRRRSLENGSMPSSLPPTRWKIFKCERSWLRASAPGRTKSRKFYESISVDCQHNIKIKN